MSRPNVEVVRGIYEGWREGDFGAVVELFDPNVVFVMRPEFPDAGTYVGREAVAGYTRSFLEPWTRITVEAQELLPAGDTVVASVVQRGVGNASGAETELRYFQLWSLRGGMVIRLENVRERDEALGAAGLGE